MPITDFIIQLNFGCSMKKAIFVGIRNGAKMKVKGKNVITFVQF